MSIILGINAYHGDSSAAIIRDGKLLAAVEEERFRRIKHWAGLPTESMKYCLQVAGIKFSDLEHIAINLDPKVNHGRRLLHVLRHLPSPRLLLARLLKLNKTATVRDAIAQAFPGETMRAEVHHVEHHLSHLASSYLCSPFEEAVNLSVDGMGDFASAAWGLGRGQELTVDGRVYFPHSLGIFYSALTQYIGFPHYGDEYKVMGLAPYGEPKFMNELRQIVLIKSDGTYELNLRYFRHHREAVPYNWDNGSPEVGTLFTPALEELLGPARKKDEPLEQKHKDLARSIQAMYEEAFFALLEKLHRQYDSDNLTLSGGCAMNSVANGKVYARSPFKHLYIQSAAGDAGGAIGAALVTHEKLSPSLKPPTSSPSSPPTPSLKPQTSNLPSPSSLPLSPSSSQPSQPSPPSSLASPRFYMKHALYGPEFSETEYATLLTEEAARISAANCQIIRFENTDELCRTTAQAISEGQVIGWFQGRLEWGPRALGNRSILGDPRRANMKDILNEKIKRRESFRPFAPSILREDVADWFETDDDVPFMMQVFQVREQQRQKIPAVTHVDGSGRLQTVFADTNPIYHQLITHFKELTSVPMVLNTSFNENEPVVCHPKEALDCFLRTKMDVIVLGQTMVRRH
ncbi:carbamoyltransferase [soil metagenome]